MPQGRDELDQSRFDAIRHGAGSRVDDRFCWLSRGPDNGCLELTMPGNNYAASRVSAWDFACSCLPYCHRSLPHGDRLGP